MRQIVLDRVLVVLWSVWLAVLLAVLLYFFYGVPGPW